METAECKKIIDTTWKGEDGPQELNTGMKRIN